MHPMPFLFVHFHRCTFFVYLCSKFMSKLDPDFAQMWIFCEKKWIFSKNIHISFQLPEVFSMSKLDFLRGGP